MWKYVSRRIRDTFERSANCFDIRSSAGVTNTSTNGNGNEKKTCTPSRWFCSLKCRGSTNGTNNTNNKRWSFEHPQCSWLGAITWSSGLILGWYASQLIHLKHKYRHNENNRPIHHKICYTLKPYVQYVKKNPIFVQTTPSIKQAIEKIIPTVYLVASNENGSNQRQRIPSGSSTTSDGSSDSDFGEVLNSIENRLGLTAIEHGQKQDGLNLLRSAANRNHAPALYNLGLCYELGLGVRADEKMAMEMYRAAAVLEHPGAMYNLSIYYGQGRGGLVRNIDTATRWLRLAAVKGQEQAIDALKSLEIPPIQETKPEQEKWVPFASYAQSENIVPTQSSLFVESVNPFSNINKCEATVY